MKIRLLIVDDHQVVRVGLRTILDRYPTIKVVGDAGDIQQAIEKIEKLQPDVVLLDVRLGDENGFEVCKHIQAMDHDIHVLVLTSFADDQMVMDAISAGADGYVLKEIGSDALVRAIEQVSSGQSVLDPSVTRAVLSRVRQSGSGGTTNKLQILSPQEHKVLSLVAEGKTNKEVGQAMGLSDKTVKNYFSNILEKLGLTRRSQAAAFFVQHRSQESVSR